MQLSRFRVILFAFLLSILALWINEQQDGKKQIKTDPAESKETYNWQSRNSISWQIDRQQPDQQTIIQTETLRYQESNKQSDFTQPVITHITPTAVTVISSQKGQSLNDNIITLSGNVTINQNSQKERKDKVQQSVLTTENISYNATLGELESRDTITIKQATGITTGIGLKANLETGHYKILSNVQGIYQTQTE